MGENNDVTQTVSVVTLEYQDLVDFDASSVVTNPKSEELMDLVGKAFGSNPECLGILAVQGVPDFVELRNKLLPLAARLPTLPDLEEACVRPETLYSTGWSHGKEQMSPGKPDFAKGSYYANPWTDSLLQALMDREPHRMQEWTHVGKEHPEFYCENVWPTQSLPELRSAFMELGQALAKVGIMLAKVCDAYCQHKHGVTTLQLEKTLRESFNAKGRLLHYFPMPPKDSDDAENDDVWCGWHNDHGSLTCLAPGMYLNEKGEMVENPDPDHAGLYIQARSGDLVRVKLPPGACGFQIGETSQILSGGVLQATPHAVLPGRRRSSETPTSRESFAVFLEPEFQQPLDIPPGKTLNDCQAADIKLPPSVVPLRHRWRPGSTFGDFHHVTVSGFTVQ